MDGWLRVSTQMWEATLDSFLRAGQGSVRRICESSQKPGLPCPQRRNWGGWKLGTGLPAAHPTRKIKQVLLLKALLSRASEHG